MKRIFLCFVLFLLAVSCNSVKKHNEQITSNHSIEGLQNDIDKLYEQLKKNHPRLYQYTSKEVLDFKFDSLKKSIKTPLNSKQFYKKLAPVVTNVRQGHVSLGNVNKRFTKKEYKNLRKRKLGFYNLDFQYLENKLYIKANRGKDSTIIGSEVVKIDDELVSDLVTIYKTQFASDGFNTTLHNRVIGNSFAVLHYKNKGHLDSISLTLTKNDTTFVKQFKRVSKKENIQKKDSLKSKKTVKPSKVKKKANRLTLRKKRKYNRKHGFIAKRNEYTRNFKFIGSDSAVAYMKIRGFNNGNYKKFYKESFTNIKDKKTQNLILDLRDNGGGRIAEVSYLYSFLTDKEFKFMNESEVTNRTPFFKHLMSNTKPLGAKALFGVLSPIITIHNLIVTKKEDNTFYYKLRYDKNKRPHHLNFKGAVYVLINGNSFSASSLISSHLKASKRAVFVGEETGGAFNGSVAGIYKIYELPTSKIRARIGLMQIESPYKQTPDGFGIKPDVEVVPTINDLIEKTDPELEWILSDIKGKNK